MKHSLKKFDVIHDNSHIKPCWKIHKRVVNTLHWEQNPRQCHYNNVVAISEKLADWARPRNKGRKVKVVHHGCDFSKYSFKKDKGNRFLFLSAVTPAKGADVALSVAKDMNLKMDFAGLGGTTSVSVEQESKINPNIQYLGEVTEEQKISLYQNAKALIFPTGVHENWTEAFGLVAIEAMSCGTPVIAWNNGALPEIVAHNKTGFICNSIEDIKNAVRNIDSIKQEDCRKRVEENFTYQVMAKKYIKLYKKLIDGKSW
jgi:glycosyltransferase involved in cell wall biosynthesis